MKTITQRLKSRKSVKNRRRFGEEVRKANPTARSFSKTGIARVEGSCLKCEAKIRVEVHHADILTHATEAWRKVKLCRTCIKREDAGGHPYSQIIKCGCNSSGYWLDEGIFHENVEDCNLPAVGCRVCSQEERYHEKEG